MSQTDIPPTTGSFSQSVPEGWQVNVGNLGQSVQCRKGIKPFGQSEDPESEPQPEVQPAPKANRHTRIARAAAAANAGLGILALGTVLLGPQGSWLLALMTAGAVSMLINAGLLFSLSRPQAE
jgi:hypothetical protein